MKISNAKVRQLLEFGIALFFAVGTSFLAQGAGFFGVSAANQFVTSSQTPDGTSTSKSPLSIPEYNGNPSVVLSDTSGLSAKSAPSDPILTGLDSSGRWAQSRWSFPSKRLPHEGRSAVQSEW